MVWRDEGNRYNRGKELKINLVSIMIYLYLDESGDLGFDFENKRPSPFFTITVVVVKNIASNQKLKKEVEIVLKRKLNPKKKQKRIITELK